jgi:hypothetical protein
VCRACDEASTGQILAQLGDSDKTGPFSSISAGNKSFNPPGRDADDSLPTPSDDDVLDFFYIPFRKRLFASLAALEKDRGGENVARYKEISPPFLFLEHDETRPFYKNLLLKETIEYGLLPDMSTGRFRPVPKAHAERERLVHAVDKTFPLLFQELNMY